MTETTRSESNNTMTSDTGSHNFNLKLDKRSSSKEKRNGKLRHHMNHTSIL